VQITQLKIQAQSVKYYYVSAVNNYKLLNVKLGLKIGEGANVPKYQKYGGNGKFVQIIKNKENDRVVRIFLSACDCNTAFALHYCTVRPQNIYAMMTSCGCYEGMIAEIPMSLLE